MLICSDFQSSSKHISSHQLAQLFVIVTMHTCVSLFC